MPKKRVPSSELKRNPLSVVFLLVQFSLILVGNLPIVLAKKFWKILLFLDKKSIELVIKLLKDYSQKDLSLKKIFHFLIVNFIRILLIIPTLLVVPFLVIKNKFNYIRRLALHAPTKPKKRGRPKKKTGLPYVYFLSKKIIDYLIPYKFRISLGLFIIAAGIFSYTFLTATFFSVLPSPTRLTNSEHPLTTEFYDRNGKLLYRLYEGRNRSLVRLDEIPKHFIQATIAIEDKNFYKHMGVDPIAIFRAFYNNLNNQTFQGASTLTQQLIKNTLLTPERTYTRKIKEVVLAIWTEHIYTKDEILTMYLNESPYGGPAWGVKAAAQTYFGKEPKDLTLAESAYLAGLPVSPTEYSPYGIHPELGVDRQRQVLHRMVEDGYVTKEQAQKAIDEPLKLLPPTNNIYAPHFVMYVKDVLANKYGERVVSQGGLKIHTTIDLGLQEEVENIVKEEIEKLANLKVSNGAAMVTDPKTGQILAMVGSADYYKEGYGNWNVTISPRQPGSSIKPITYAEAFKQGFTPGNTILDTPVSFPDGDRRYSPVNYDSRFHGPVSIRTALGSSYNIPAVKLLARVGMENMIQTAKDLGITTFNDTRGYGLSLTLGGGEVKMIDMMSVYGTFAQNGLKHPVTPILKVTDSSGNTLEEYTDTSTQVLQPEIAYLITNILFDNQARTPAFGPNSLLNIPKHQVAVKTGTTDNKKDNWTFGYTPDYVVGVWVGNNNGTPMHPSLTSGVTGAAPIWNRITRGLLANNEPVVFKKPSGVVNVLVDGRRDIGVSGILPKALVRIQKRADQTIMFDPYSTYATSSATAVLPIVSN